MRLKTRGRFNVKRLSLHLADRVLGTEFDRALRAARLRPGHVFVFGWNRGLGDIALGLIPLFAQIRASCAQSRIIVFTRPDLREPFMLAGVDHLHVIPGLERGKPVDVVRAAADAGVALKGQYTIFAEPDPTRWLDRRRHEHPPVLQWKSSWNLKADRLLSVAEGADVIGAHVDSETAQHYGYVKDWPIASWRALIARFPRSSNVQWVLFGNEARASIEASNITDLRGRTSFLELMAVIRTRCRVLIAPDSGVLTAAYYLDQDFPLDIVSLWSDPRQGILKQGCPSPNPRLNHVALRAPAEDIRKLPLQDVAAAVEAALGRVPQSSRKESDAVSR